MNIIPAIDIYEGKCAQLVGGDPATASYYGDPVDIATSWEGQGAELLHVIDLDAALSSGEKNNKKAILDIVSAVNVPVQVGGGIRSMDYARELLATDIDRIILGTWALLFYHEKNVEGLENLKSDFGVERVMFAADFRAGRIVLHGWQEDSTVAVDEFMKGTQSLCWGFLATNVDVEGRMGGIDLAAVEAAVTATDKPVIVSGGISSKADLAAIRTTGAWGVVIGKALYENKLDYGELLAAGTG